MKGMFKMLGGFLVLITLFACGSGGGSSGGFVAGPAPSPTVTGTVSDTVLDPVANATVTVSGGANKTAVTDAAGRFALTGLPKNTDLTITVSGPGPGFFHASAQVNLTTNKATVLDFYLPNADFTTIADVDLGGTAEATAVGDLIASVAFPADALVDDTDTLYVGDATAYITPIDVGELGFGLAPHQFTLPGVFSAAVAPDASIVELYGSAAFSVYDIPTDPDIPISALNLSASASTPTTLEIPIPAAPPELRLTAPPSIDLWNFDAANTTWVPDGTANLTVDAFGNPIYSGEVTRPGMWQAGQEVLAGDLTEITGRLVFSNGAAAAGTTVYVNGVDYAYQDLTVTDANGNFSLLAKRSSSNTIHAVVWANRTQWPHEEPITTIDADTTSFPDDVTLPFTPPASGAFAIVDWRNNRPGDGGIAPNVLGFTLASGRPTSDPAVAENVSDVTLIANELGLIEGFLELTPTASGGLIKVLPGATFESLRLISPNEFDTSDTFVDLSSHDFAVDGPILVVVQTAHGHFGKISIDAVEDISELSGNKDAWKVSFRHAFSLTRNF